MLTIIPFNKYYLLGPCIGFLGFFAGLASMENIFFRADSSGKKKFNISVFIDYLKLPFNWEKIYIIWAIHPDLPFLTRLKMLNLNWVFMTCIGCIIPLIHHNYLKYNI